MKTFRVFPLLLLLALLPQSSALAWSGPGHAAVAVMAYRELSAAQQRSLTDILRSHPSFGEWQQQFNAGRRRFPRELDLGMFLFVRASTWPDAIRGTDDRQLRRFDHPNWHFVNYPLRPPQFAADATRPFPQDDVVFGIGEARRTLADAGADPALRAAMLSWLIHLDGDIHQPMHCVALIEGSFVPPEGDRGGGRFDILVPAGGQRRRTTNLHSFWDQQLGAALVPDPVRALNDARSLKDEHARRALEELSAADDQSAWSIESRDTASRSGYRFRGQRLVQRRLVPRGYPAAAGRIARRRLALAGYRLSDDLRNAL